VGNVNLSRGDENASDVSLKFLQMNRWREQLLNAQ
jgi:hypothetical protein